MHGLTPHMILYYYKNLNLFTTIFLFFLLAVVARNTVFPVLIIKII